MEKLETTEDKPVITIEKPVITTDKPVITTEKSVITTGNPVTTEKPETTTETRVITTEKPETTTVTPMNGGNVYRVIIYLIFHIFRISNIEMGCRDLFKKRRGYEFSVKIMSEVYVPVNFRSVQMGN